MEGSYDYWLEQKNVNYQPTCDTLLSCIDSTPENSPQLTSLDSVKFCDFQNYQNCGDQTVSSTVGDVSNSDLSMKMEVQGFDGTGPLQPAANDNSLFADPSGGNLNNEGLYNHTAGHSGQGHSGSPHSSYSTSPVGSYCNADLSGSSSRNVSPQISSSSSGEERLPTNGYQCSTSGNDVQYSGSLERYYSQGQSIKSNTMYSGNVGQLGQGHYGVQFEGHAYRNLPYPSASILYTRLNSAASDSGMQFTPDQQYQIMQEVFQRCQGQLGHFHQNQSMQVPSYGQSNFQLPPQCHSGNFRRNQNSVYQGYNFSAGHQGAMPSPAMQSSQYQVTSSVGQVAAPVKRKPRTSVNKSRPSEGQGQLKVQGYSKGQGYIKEPVVKYNLSDFAFKESGKLMGYNCPLCPPHKRFANKSNLKTHIMVHTGEKPFHCPECHTAFRQKAHMMKHRMTHRKEMKNRPVQCMV